MLRPPAPTIAFALIGCALIGCALIGCALTARSDPPSNRSAQLEPAATASDRVAGTIGGHAFTIELAGGGVVLEQRAERLRWRLATGVLELTDSGPRDRESRFLIERSPRTIVRQHDDNVYSVITEVVVDAGGRIFACLYQETVADPESEAGRAAARRGVASCSSLHVDP